MKKVLLALLAMAVMGSAAFAQDSSADSEKKFNYTNAQIFKVLDSGDSYIVTYAKDKMGRDSVGSVQIPKKWYKEIPRKFEIRELPAGLDPYITVITNGGEFYKVWLTIPNNRMDKIWGVAQSQKEPADGIEKVSLSFN